MIKAQQRARIRALAVMMVMVAGVSACGGSSKSSTTSSSTAGAPASASGSASSTRTDSSAAGAKFNAVLTGQDRTPVATKRWHYTVHVSSAAGRPLSGTVDTEFAFAGQVVGREVPPTHRLNHGALHDTVEFPKQAVGQPIELQVVVHTSAGSRTLDWPVSVKP